jgi:hypothetical protein
VPFLWLVTQNLASDHDRSEAQMHIVRLILQFGRL